MARPRGSDDVDALTPAAVLEDGRVCSQPLRMWATFTGHEYLFAGALANRTGLNGTFDHAMAAQMMQQAWAAAAAARFPSASASSSSTSITPAFSPGPCITLLPFV